MIFGIFGMIADFLSDIKIPDYAATVRAIGIVLLILFAIFEIYRSQILKVPIVFIEEKDRLFTWNKIPGNDSEKLKTYLNQNFNIDLPDSTKIEKSSDDTTMRIDTEKNRLWLRLNDDKTKVQLKIDDGRTNDFLVKKENNDLNIYDLRTSFNMFNSFIQTTNLNRALEVLESKSQLETNDLIIPILNNPRNSHNQEDWIKVWKALIKEWQEIDYKLKAESISRYVSYYHIVPQVILPLSFALGASVNMRRSLVIYHRQTEQYYQVINLRNPRELFNEPIDFPKKPLIIPENQNNLPKVNKLILHIIISARHLLNFENHPDNAKVDSSAIVYNFDLDPEKDWLPYVQLIFQRAKPLINRYREIEICLICPSAIAFALGMAFSRNPHITVCHWFADNQYRPVFPLSEIERQLPFS